MTFNAMTQRFVERPRRLRRSEALRAMVRETRLVPAQLVQPLFVCPGEGVRREISSMPGQFNLSIDMVVEESLRAHRAGVGGVMLFGLPESKDAGGTSAFVDDGIVQRAFRAVKRAAPDLLLLATELAGIGGPELPLEVSAIDSFGAVTDAPERSLTIVARQQVSLARVLQGEELLCETLERCLAVSRYLLEQAPAWLD